MRHIARITGGNRVVPERRVPLLVFDAEQQNLLHQREAIVSGRSRNLRNFKLRSLVVQRIKICAIGIDGSRLGGIRTVLVLVLGGMAPRKLRSLHRPKMVAADTPSGGFQFTSFQFYIQTSFHHDAIMPGSGIRIIPEILRCSHFVALGAARPPCAISDKVRPQNTWLHS